MCWLSTEPPLCQRCCVYIARLSGLLAVAVRVLLQPTSSSNPRRLGGRSAGTTLQVARRAKERAYPELAVSGRCHLTVLGIEVGGRWSSEAAIFVRLLAWWGCMILCRVCPGFFCRVCPGFFGVSQVRPHRSAAPKTRNPKVWALQLRLSDPKLRTSDLKCRNWK